MSDVIEAEFEETTAIAVVSEQSPATLFRSDDPEIIIEKASKVATALKKIVDERKLIENIKGKQHPKIEAWLTLGAMLNLTDFIEWTRPIDKGWEARAIVKNMRGEIISSSEAQCTREESMWRSRDDYAIRSMAQTRALSKAYASRLRWVMILAGYSPTPAEEMPKDTNLSVRRGDDSRMNVPSIQSLMARAKEKQLCTDGASFCAWAASNVVGCKDFKLGVKPTEDQRFAIHAVLGLSNAKK